MKLIDEVREALKDYACETGMDAEQRERIQSLASRLDGMAIVPVEPTEKMLVGAVPSPDDGGAPYCYDRELAADLYRAMLKEAE